MTIQPLPQNSGALAPAGLTLQDQRRIRAALGSSTSANTRRAYDQAWRRFVAWTEARGAVALPATSELAEEGLSVATLRLQKAALAKVHRSAGHQDPTDNEGVKRVMAGIARANGPPPAPGETADGGGPGGGEGNGQCPAAAPGPGQAGGERPGCRAPRARGRRFVVSAARWSAPALGGRGASVGRRGAPGGRRCPVAHPPVQDGSGGGGRGPVRWPGGRPGPAGHHARGCGGSWIPPRRSSGSPPARSAGGSTPRQRPRAWAKASPATAAAWAWPRTWPPRGWSCRN